MSFGPTAGTKSAMSGMTDVSKTAQTNSTADRAQGGNLLNLGGDNVTSGTNFFNTLLNGNAANTTATLQPSIDQIRNGVGTAMTAVNTLAPRGGGRTAMNYGLSFAPQAQIQNLFNQTRTQAATALPQIGLQQQQMGGNLLGIGNQALNTAGTGYANLTDANQKQQQITNNAWSGLGQGIFGLATVPFGSTGKSLLGRL